ncbi:Nipped-B protein [Aphelenchoides fujianensis]|nr:Nipped-B protein [Aphelenchoides fujianensis]
MDNDFNRLAAGFGQGQPQHPGVQPQGPYAPNQQAAFQQQLLYGNQQVPHAALSHHLQGQHYLNAGTSNNAAYNVQQPLQQMVNQRGGLPAVYSQQQQQLLAQQQAATSLPQTSRQADFFMQQMGDRGMQLHAQQPQAAHHMYASNVGDPFQQQYHQMPAAYQQPNAHQLYMQQQQNYLQEQQRQAVASLQSPPQPAVQHAAFLPQPQLVAQQLQQQAVRAQQAAHLPPQQRPSVPQVQPAVQQTEPRPKPSTTSPAARHRSPPRPAETTMKAAERAAALVEENARILQQREEEAERERREHQRKANEQIQRELKQKRREADTFTAAMQERLNAIPEPLHLGTCHTLSKGGGKRKERRDLRLCLQSATSCPCRTSVPPRRPFCPSTSPTPTSRSRAYLAAVLNSCMSELNDVELKHEDGELNDLEPDEMNPLYGKGDGGGAEERASRRPSAAPPAPPSSAPQERQSSSSSIENQPLAHPQTAEEQHAQAELRRQVASVGKQPKGAPPRKNEVDSLFDSLTGYFDPTTSNRRRGEELNENHKRAASDFGSSLHRSRKRQKLDGAAANRSPTPEDVIHQRDVEWLERQRLREEKLRRRQEQAANSELWSHDVMAENDSIVQFTSIVERLLEQVDEASDAAAEGDFLQIDRHLLSTLCMEAQKLKCFRKFHTVPLDRLVRLLNVLERIVREVVNEDGTFNLPILEGDDESDETLKELVDERLCRAADAAFVSLLVMTSPKMHKQVLIEDLIERAIALCKETCQSVLFPAFDLSQKNANTPAKGKKSENARKQKRSDKSTSPLVNFLYKRTCEMMSNFAELARFQNLNETTLHNLCSLASPVFFIDGTIEGIRLLSTVFSAVPAVRKGILQELLESLHRLPSSKNHRNCFRLNEAQWISNFAVLMMQLIQSVVKVPSKRKNEALDEMEEVQQNDITVEDAAVMESYSEAQGLAVLFFSGFLGKCTAKSEDDHRRLFEQFLQDILTALYRPAWPVAELMLTVLGNVLVKKFRSKSEISIRLASLEYLGTISARLRKDRVQARQDDKARLDVIIRCIVGDEQEEAPESVDISGLSISDKVQKLEQALIDYVITKNADDVSVEYTIRFYVAEWYRETLTDMEIGKERHRQLVEGGQASDSEVRKDERRLQKLLDRGEKMKAAILRLVDKKYLKRRTQYIAKTGNTIVDSDAVWVVKYLASKREFSQSFEHYLKQITYGVSNESSVNVRTKAMRCLTHIIEADNKVLLFQDVHKAVNGRMTDPNTAVREATAELIGKYDTGVAVRKRIIRILRDIIDRQPDYPKNPEIVARIVRRVADEDGVRKLVLETIYNLWFVPTLDREAMDVRITLMADAVHEMIKLNFVDHLKQLFAAILKEHADKPHLEEACRQLVDALVDRILQLDQEAANADATGGVDAATGEISAALVDTKRVIQQRLIASLTTLSVFSNVKAGLLIRHAQVFVPYLAIKPTSQTEIQVLAAILQMLERIHPSDSFLHSIDSRIDELLSSQMSASIISTSVACAGAIYDAFPKFCPKLFGRLAKFLDYLRMTKVQPSEKLLEQRALALLRKVMYSVGVICRYFDVDAVMGRYPNEKAVVDMRESFKMFGKADDGASRSRSAARCWASSATSARPPTRSCG